VNVNIIEEITIWGQQLRLLIAGNLISLRHATLSVAKITARNPGMRSLHLFQKFYKDAMLLGKKDLVVCKCPFKKRHCLCIAYQFKRIIKSSITNGLLLYQEARSLSKIKLPI
jgi:hypothetical protein